jgi:hypothetical protein
MNQSAGSAMASRCKPGAASHKPFSAAATAPVRWKTLAAKTRRKSKGIERTRLLNGRLNMLIDCSRHLRLAQSCSSKTRHSGLCFIATTRTS